MGNSKLGWKLGLTYLLVIIITMLVLSFLILTFFYQSYLGERKSIGFTYANIVSSKIASALWRHDIVRVNYLAQEYGQEIGQRLIVVDSNRKVIADSAQALKGDLLPFTEVTTAIKGTNASGVHNSVEYGDVLYLSVPISLGGKIAGAIFLAMDVNDITAKMQTIKERLTWISFIVGAFIFVVSLLFASFIAKPISLLKTGVKRISEGDYGLQIEVTSRDELGDLAASFNDMSRQLKWQDDLRRQFVADAAHELRTPLTSLKVVVNNLSHTVDDKHESVGYLEVIDVELDRLTKLVNDLLMLSSVEAKPKLKLEEINVSELLHAVHEEILPLAQKKIITVNFKSYELIYWPLDGQKIYRAIYNLLDNAVKYSPQGSTVEIKYHTERDTLIVIIADQGEGISEEDKDKIFERFYRVDRARPRATGGSGLGLAIVKEIINLHSGSISVNNQRKPGTEFIIKIPKM